MSMIGHGLSFYDYAKYCTFSNLVGSTGATPTIVAGSLDSLKTRQLSDACRFSVYCTTTGQKTISFDVIPPSVSPNVFGENGLRGVGMFALLGFKKVSSPASAGGTVYPGPSLVCGRLQGYTDAFATTGTISHDTQPFYFGGFGDQANSTGKEITISNPYLDLSTGTQGLVIPLLESWMATGTPAQYWPGQSWVQPNSVVPRLKAFKVTLTFAAVATGVYVFDLGRVWIGNRFSPLEGFANIQHGFNDQSPVVTSRDGQAYPQYFTRRRTLSVAIPAMYEIEAMGYGDTYSGLNTFPSQSSTVNCLQWAQTFLGTSREAILAVSAFQGSNQQVDQWHSVRVYRNAVYGHVSQWQNISQLQARKRPVIKTTSGGDNPDSFARLFSSGLTMVEEG